MALIRLKAAVR